MSLGLLGLTTAAAAAPPSGGGGGGGKTKTTAATTTTTGGSTTTTVASTSTGGGGAAKLTAVTALSRHRVLATYDRDLDPTALQMSTYAFYSTQAVNLPVLGVSRASNNQAFVLTAAQEPVTYEVKKPKTSRPITFTGSSVSEPKMLSATPLSTTQILVTFSEPVGTSALQASAYQITVQGTATELAVLGAAAFGSSQTQVLLTTAPQQAVPYVLSIVGPIQALTGAYFDPTAPSIISTGGDDDQEFEVWAIDQSNSPGVPFGGLLNIYDGQELVEDARAAVPEVVDLAGTSRDLCRAHTGSDPVRPHSVILNSSRSHAVIAFVASGHVLFIEAATRAPVRCIQMSMGSGGLRHAHAAIPAPNDAYVLVANQGGKLLERINTDANDNGQPYEDATDIVHDTAATLNLATCVTPNGVACETPGVAPRPDSSLVGPMINRSSTLTFLTLAGGGLLVVDSREGGDPPPIVAEYDNTSIHANGFGGMQKGAVTKDRIYLNSGAGGTNGSAADLYSLRLAAFPMAPAFNPPNTPAPTVVFSFDGPGHDSHGLLLLNRDGKRRFLWAADRPANAIEVVDTTTDIPVNSFSVVSEHSADPAPELFELSPRGSHAFVSLRGPCPVTGNVPGVNNAVGDTPGVGVLRVEGGGRSGTLLGIAPIDNVDGSIDSCSPSGAPASNNRADVHGIAVRVLHEDEGARTPPPVDHDLERRRKEQLHPRLSLPCPVQQGATVAGCDKALGEQRNGKWR